MTLQEGGDWDKVAPVYKSTSCTEAHCPYKAAYEELGARICGDYDKGRDYLLEQYRGMKVTARRIDNEQTKHSGIRRRND